MIEHLLIRCVFSRDIWHHVLQWIGLAELQPRGDEASFNTWWRRASQRARKDTRKGLNSIIILTSWFLWKYRNRVVFDAHTPRPQILISEIRDEAKCWALAGAKRLGRILSQ
ncbi:hypothetical protein PR202_gb29394 [Eleusine coracana subsp. coracana]|uniref:Reverse transcriptase zinc-binding domain-containing protein n=1 Tax=Eleusine coracana subsp. coracana TaxID=191504 RepID=A0AAV5FWZ3_ELECO|nr:hypothetical protein PR202_gb29394 [Eleusine coracana subsp. coracana]